MMSEELVELRRELISLQNEIIHDSRTTKIFHSEKDYKEFSKKCEKDYYIYQGIKMAIELVEKKLKGVN